MPGLPEAVEIVCSVSCSNAFRRQCRCTPAWGPSTWSSLVGQANSGAQDDRFQKDRFCRGDHFAGAGSGLPKFTLGTTRDASDASKYALFGLKPMPGANKLLGNCWT